MLLSRALIVVGLLPCRNPDRCISYPRFSCVRIEGRRIVKELGGLYVCPATGHQHADRERFAAGGFLTWIRPIVWSVMSHRGEVALGRWTIGSPVRYQFFSSFSLSLRINLSWLFATAVSSMGLDWPSFNRFARRRRRRSESSSSSSKASAKCCVHFWGLGSPFLEMPRVGTDRTLLLFRPLLLLLLLLQGIFRLFLPPCVCIGSNDV